MTESGVEWSERAMVVVVVILCFALGLEFEEFDGILINMRLNWALSFEGVGEREDEREREWVERDRFEKEIKNTEVNGV